MPRCGVRTTWGGGQVLAAVVMKYFSRRVISKCAKKIKNKRY